MPQTQQTPTGLTNDTLFVGRLVCRQYRQGYRFSVDAVLVAHFAVPKPGQQVLDLGCGCGVIGLITAHRHPEISVSCLEIQEELATLAAENGLRNGLGDRFSVIRGDIRAINQVCPPESVDLVICNPPYRKKETGRINREDQAALARHELAGTINDFVRAAAFAVKNRGRVVFVYPARRTNSLLTALHEHRLTPKRLQPVYSYPGEECACLVLVEARKNGGEQLEILAPLYIYERRDGDFAPALQALYREEPCWPR